MCGALPHNNRPPAFNGRTLTAPILSSRPPAAFLLRRQSGWRRAINWNAHASAWLRCRKGRQFKSACPPVRENREASTRGRSAGTAGTFTACMHQAGSACCAPASSRRGSSVVRGGQAGSARSAVTTASGVRGRGIPSVQSKLPLTRATMAPSSPTAIHHHRLLPPPLPTPAPLPRALQKRCVCISCLHWRDTEQLDLRRPAARSADTQRRQALPRGPLWRPQAPLPDGGMHACSTSPPLYPPSLTITNNHDRQKRATATPSNGENVIVQPVGLSAAKLTRRTASAWKILHTCTSCWPGSAVRPGRRLAAWLLPRAGPQPASAYYKCMFLSLCLWEHLTSCRVQGAAAGEQAAARGLRGCRRSMQLACSTAVRVARPPATGHHLQLAL
jgi:hypothetical protein